MLRVTVGTLGLFLILAGLVEAQTAKPAEAKARTESYQLTQPYQANPAKLQTGGLGDTWGVQTVEYPGLLSNYIVSTGAAATEDSGLALAPADDAARAHLKIPKGQGLIVTTVGAQGAAARAGVCQNDILLSLGDSPLAKADDVEKQLKAAGEKALDLIVLHEGQRKTLQVQPHIKVFFGPVQPAPPEFWIGITVSAIEPALQSQLRLPPHQGLIATQVIDEGPAAKAGFKVNDILMSMGEKPLSDQVRLVDLVQKNGDKHVTMEIIREGSRETIAVTPERRKNVTLRTAIVQHVGGWNVVGPGVVLPGNQTRADVTGNFDDFLVFTQQHKDEPLSKRLDSMDAEIKEFSQGDRGAQQDSQGSKVTGRESSRSTHESCSGDSPHFVGNRLLRFLKDRLVEQVAAGPIGPARRRRRCAGAARCRSRSRRSGRRRRRGCDRCRAGWSGGGRPE